MLKWDWKTAFWAAVLLLGWVAAVLFYVAINQSVTVEIQKRKSNELEHDLKLLSELLPGRLSRSQVEGRGFQRLKFIYNERDTVVEVRYWWDKMH